MALLPISADIHKVAILPAAFSALLNARLPLAVGRGAACGVGCWSVSPAVADRTPPNTEVPNRSWTKKRLTIGPFGYISVTVHRFHCHLSKRQTEARASIWRYYPGVFDIDFASSLGPNSFHSYR